MDRVVKFCKGRSRTYPIKGEPGMSKQVIRKTSARSKVWMVGVDAVKEQIHTRIAPRGDTMIKFSDELALDFYSQFTAEARTVKMRRG